MPGTHKKTASENDPLAANSPRRCFRSIAEHWDSQCSLNGRSEEHIGLHVAHTGVAGDDVSQRGLANQFPVAAFEIELIPKTVPVT
jgi:hypothetical protein